MNAVKIFLSILFEKKCAFSLDNLLNGTIFAERERERERLASDTLCVAFWCARTLKIIATTLGSKCNVVAFLFPDMSKIKPYPYLLKPECL